jgi:CubicO group peptidase (beta-lactamase class C family)
MSGPRLERINAYVERHIEAQHFAGAVTLVARNGRIVHFQAQGMQDIEAGVPMQKNSIFRIYSMTKPLTSVAVLMLFEEGHFLLNDPVSRYLPQLAGLEVGVDETDPDSGEVVHRTVPAVREMTIRDLLRHTSGLTYGFWGSSTVDKLYLEQGVLAKDETLADTVAKLAAIPLKHQPGTRWEYSVSTDVLGRLVEVVSGMRFDRFLETRIFTPLGMHDTAFYVPADRASRLAKVYTPNDDMTIRPAEPGGRDFLSPPSYLSGGGGLVSTAGDYLRFAQMLLNRGELDGTRILGPRTAALMTQDHLGDIARPPWMKPYGFGLGFLVSPEPGRSGSILSQGSHGWGGMAHTTFWVDPKEELIGIFMIQILPRAPISYRDLFKPVVYQAILN